MYQTINNYLFGINNNENIENKEIDKNTIYDGYILPFYEGYNNEQKEKITRKMFNRLSTFTLDEYIICHNEFNEHDLLLFIKDIENDIIKLINSDEQIKYDHGFAIFHKKHLDKVEYVLNKFMFKK